MKIKDILKKQGEIYKNLTSKKTVQKTNEIFEKPLKLVLYGDYKISEQEYKAITELEKLIGEKPEITNGPVYHSFEIFIKNNKITRLQIIEHNLNQIPKQINNLQNLQYLNLCSNKISKIENLYNLQNLKEIWLNKNKIKKLENLGNLKNLKMLYICSNPIINLEEIDNLREANILVRVNWDVDVFL